MVDPQAQPTLVETAENPLPEGGETDWLYLNKGKVWLRFAAWPAAVDEPQGTVIIATGRAEFIEKYAETIEDLQARGFAVAAFDWRGQGGSSRLLRNVAKGHVADFDDYVDDLEAAVAGAAIRGLPRPFYLLAHSMGGAVALLAASRLADQIERMVLTAPLIELADKRASSRWAKNAAGVAAAVGLARSSLRPGRAPAPQDVPFETNVVTSDRRRFARTQAVLRAEPRLGLGAPTVRWYAAANRAIRTLNEPGFGDELKIPVLIVACGMDTVVSVRAIERFAKTLRGGGRVMIPGARHEILMERTGFRTLFWAAFDAFIPGTGLRLPTDIAPPKVKIAPPKTLLAPVPAEPPVAPEAPDLAATGPEHADDGSNVETRPAVETATTTPVEASADAAAEPTAETDNTVEARASETLAPPAPEAAAVAKRSRFGFFRRRKAAEPEAESADEATAPETAPTEPADDDASRSQEAAETNAAEAAFAAAANLVAEATRGETRPSPQAWQGPSTAPETGPTTTEQPAPDPAASDAAADDTAVRAAGGNGTGRVSRLFRRRDTGAPTDAAATPTDEATGDVPEQPSDSANATGDPTAAAPESEAEPTAEMTQSDGVPAGTITFKTASETPEPAPEATAVGDTAAPVATETSDPITTGVDAAEVAAAPSDGVEPSESKDESAKAEPVALADADAAETSGATAEPEDDGPATASDPSEAAASGTSRRKIGGGARPTPRPVRRGRGKR
ncbi:alpha-beta hydrolase superfamily lysophospholipase [Amorphus suaedae]